MSLENRTLYLVLVGDTPTRFHRYHSKLIQCMDDEDDPSIFLKRKSAQSLINESQRVGSKLQ